jgi:anaerobic magnesium-protoporphyrin IX monomethyl ester cyclase
MKIVLTHGYFLSEDPKELEIMRPYPTLGLLYISSFLKEQKKDVTVLDSTFSSQEKWQNDILEIQPKIIAFYTNLMTKIRVLELVQFIKKNLPDCSLIVGGPDVTYNTENYLRAGFDFAIIGEGEQTMLELTSALEQKGDISEIEGIALLAGDNVITTPSRTKIKDLQDIPFPDRDSIPFEKYLGVWGQHHGKRTANISTQRGCPYTCKWCSTAVYGQSYRRNPPNKVVEEILELKNKFQVEALWFVDDVFTVSHKWISELYDEFKKHNLKIDFECITRAERLPDEVLMQLKEMGCFRIWIGAESGSQKIIDKMDRRVSLEEVKDRILRTQELGMEAGTFIMVGYPGETKEDIRLTKEYLVACRPNYLTITKAYPIKGTSLYTEVENKLLLPSDWSKSTDREIQIELPYSNRFYRHSIRYLMNSWKAERTNALVPKLKAKLSYLLMNINAK